MISKPIFKTITFFWGESRSQSTLVLHDRTLEDAVAQAREFGWREWCWYRPSTWGNHYVAYGSDKFGVNE